MPLTLRRGVVTAIREREEGLVRLEVDDAPCVAYPRLTGPVALGDDVVVNVQARELGLGSGGFDVLLCNLTRGLGLPGDAGAHVMKLPYTPIQYAVRHGEEDLEPASELAGMVTVCCSLHSQVAPVCAALDGLRVAYVQVAGGALPVWLSDAVRELRRRGLISFTVAVGPCFGGDVETVSAASALGLAHARGAEAAVCSIGPGVVGTGSRLGHGGLGVLEAFHAAAAMAGYPILAPRISQADERERHLGLSHHTQAIQSLALAQPRVGWPASVPVPTDRPVSAEVVDASGWREACGDLPLSHMGRGPDDDPVFFEAAYAAGLVARREFEAKPWLPAAR
jgi:hypothetical protein